MRNLLFFLAWPLRAAVAVAALTLGICILPDRVLWEACKRDARELMRVRLT